MEKDQREVKDVFVDGDLAMERTNSIKTLVKKIPMSLAVLVLHNLMSLVETFSVTLHFKGLVNALFKGRAVANLLLLKQVSNVSKYLQRKLMIQQCPFVCAF